MLRITGFPSNFFATVARRVKQRFRTSLNTQMYNKSCSRKCPANPVPAHVPQILFPDMSRKCYSNASYLQNMHIEGTSKTTYSCPNTLTRTHYCIITTCVNLHFYTSSRAQGFQSAESETAFTPLHKNVTLNVSLSPSGKPLLRSFFLATSSTLAALRLSQALLCPSFPFFLITPAPLNTQSPRFALR